MASLNKASLIGNLGKDAEMRFTQGGTPVATFTMATTEKWTDQSGQKKESTQWHRIVLWGKSAETLKDYLTKGKQIYVEGRIEYREYEKDGQKKNVTEIKADKIVLLGGGSSNGSGRDRDDHDQRRAPARQPAAPAADANDDDIPF